MAADGWRRDIASGTSRTTMAAATKSSRTDVVTLHDRAAEATIVAALTARRPDDAIVGEEGTATTGHLGAVVVPRPDRRHDELPLRAPAVVDVGRRRRRRRNASPAPCSSRSTGELFAAARGAGATRNGEPIRASSEVDASLALVATGFGYLPARRAEQARRLATLIEHIRDIRRGGSAALDLCYAAAGMVDAYFEDGLNSWDIVAGELIAREAGCRTGDFAGGPATPAAAPRRPSGAVRASSRPARRR